MTSPLADNEESTPATDVPWDGTYTTNDYQWVEAADARGLADALEHALDDVPDQSCVPDEPLIVRGRVAILLERDEVDGVSSLRWFSGRGKPVLRDFIRFCRAGAFYIG